VRKLAGRKDQSAREFLAFLYSDERLFENIRAEAALALGALRNKESLPLLLQGLLHDQEKIRVSSARALSFYSNDDTGEPFMTMIRRLDSVRMNTALQAIADAGWKHLAAFKALAESEDLYVAKAGIKLLGGARDPETVDYLLTLLGAPRDGAAGAIITALGDSGDPRALEALSRIAGDPSERAGVEAELGAALAALGDQRSAALIGDMIKNTSEPDTRRRLAAAYRKLTGMSYQGE
jgi:HEAT repeat protein